MSALVWSAWSLDWALYDKVSFDGAAKVIYVHSEVTEFDIRTDLYTSWIDWVTLQDNIKYLPALRVTGLDAIGGGVYTGDVYFLINGWKFSVDLQKVKITGVLYSDDYDSAYFTPALVTQYPVTVAALVNTVETGAGGTAPTVQEIRIEMDDNSSKLLAINTKVQTLNNAPTAAQNRIEMDSNSTQLAAIKAKTDTITTAPSAVAIADQVRTELTPELVHLMTLENNTGLTSTQATMLLSMYELLGMDPTKPLVVTNTLRTAGTITQTIVSTTDSTTVTRI